LPGGTTIALEMVEKVLSLKFVDAVNSGTLTEGWLANK
jgi:hypothetical protein